MEFRIQDLLKNIIPGAILVPAIIVVLENVTSINLKSFFEGYIKDAGEIWLVILLISSYIMGFIIDALSSNLEYLIYRKLSKPSYILLNDKTTRYRMVKVDEIVTNLGHVASASYDKDFSERIFKCANHAKDSNGSELIKAKVGEYYNSYMFSRNLVLPVVIFLVILNVLYFSYILLVLSLILFWVLADRWRKKAICYSRQVLYASKS